MQSSTAKKTEKSERCNYESTFFGLYLVPRIDDEAAIQPAEKKQKQRSERRRMPRGSDFV